jgi:ParB family transcriptional regulator, chromosome partitioning protein
MTRKPEKRGLGRGLSALMAEINTSPAPTRAEADVQPRRAEILLPIEKLRANPDQPRRDFNQDDLESLTASIAEKGIIQPLIVRPDPTLAGDFQIVAGERRWRAAQKAKLHEIPVIIRDFNDTEVLEVAIIENIQRSDLNAIEEALGYKQLMQRFNHTQEKLSEVLGKSRSHIANLLRLLNLPEGVLEYVRAGTLSAGHARALITSDDPVMLARQIITKDLSVRQTEALVKRAASPPKKRQREVPEKDIDTLSLEADLAANIGMKVSITHNAGGESGQISISYKSFDQLDALCRILSHGDTAGPK